MNVNTLLTDVLVLEDHVEIVFVDNVELKRLIEDCAVVVGSDVQVALLCRPCWDCWHCDMSA